MHLVVFYKIKCITDKLSICVLLQMKLFYYWSYAVFLYELFSLSELESVSLSKGYIRVYSPEGVSLISVCVCFEGGLQISDGLVGKLVSCDLPFFHTSTGRQRTYLSWGATDTSPRINPPTLLPHSDIELSLSTERGFAVGRSTSSD